MGERYDALVVGAGLSGLACATRLRAAGCSVVVLEARRRVGGRVLSAEVAGVPIDLGAQWIGPTQARMHRLVERFSIATFDTFHAGRKVLDLAGRVSTYRSSIPSLSPLKLVALQAALTRAERAVRRIDPVTPWQVPGALRLDGLTVEAWKRRNALSAEVRALFDVGVRTVFGTEPSELSLLYFLAYARAGGSLMELLEIEGAAQQTRFVFGAQQVVSALAEELGDAIRLGAPVRALEQSADRVEAVTDTGRVAARRAVVAVPPALAGRIAYSPALPAAKDALLQRFPMGQTIKCHVAYERPLWRDDGLSGEVVATTGPLSVVFDNSPPDGARGVLVCFSVGARGRAFGELAPERRRAAVTELLVRWFGPRAAKPLAYRDKNWAAAEWTRGCPTGFLPPGVLGALGAELRAPAGRLHFASTETATEWTGYMEGALQAGERAATEVLGAL